jgi:predicted phosphodiesterase
MLNDFELITHQFSVQDDIKIYPIFDVHLGAAEHMERAWSQFCIDILNDPNAYIILGGDLVNNATKNSVSNVYEETMRPREQKRVITEMLTPLRDRILCAVTGNHERRSMRDVDSDITYDIMCKLDLEHLYRTNMAFMKVQLGRQRSESGSRCDADNRPAYVFCVTHGSGGGMLTGGNVNRNERFGYVMDGVDCLITGHTHKPWVTQPAKIVVDTRNNKVTTRPFKVISATSWLNYGGYAAQKMLLPTSHVKQIVVLSGRGKDIKVLM